MQYWLTAENYSDLYNTLLEADAALAGEFADFFEPNPDRTYYQVKNYNGYMSWLNELFHGDIDADFIAWSDYQYGVSNQNTGGL